MRVIASWLVAVAGCLEPTVQRCGDKICPISEICLPDEQRCVAAAVIEACDGVAPGTACVVAGANGRCTQHGSAVTCDPVRCGDGVIDGALNEACDGDAPIAEHCVDLGYDLGLPTCAADCAHDPSPCRRFGWETVVNAPVFRMWTDGTVLAYARTSPYGLVITGGGFAISDDGFVMRMAGGAGKVVAVADGGLRLFTPTGKTDLAPPFDPVYIRGLAVADDGAIWATQNCDVWRHDGAWKHVVQLGPNCPDRIAIGPIASGARVFVSSPAGEVHEIESGAPVLRVRVATAVTGLAVRTVAGVEALFVGSGDGLHRMAFTQDAVEQLATQPVVSLALTTRNAYAASANGLVTRWNGIELDVLRAPTSTLADDGKDGLYAYTGPIYRFSGMAFGELEPPVQNNFADHMVATLDLVPAPLVASTHDVYEVAPGGTTWNALGSPVLPNEIRALAGVSRSHWAISVYVEPHLPGTEQIWVEDAPSPLEQISAPGAPLVDGLWMASDGTLFVAGRLPAAGFLGRWAGVAPGGTWEVTTPAGCAMYGVHGVSISHVVAVGSCEGSASIWRYDGTAWSELHRAPAIAGALWAVRVFASGAVFAAGDDGGVWTTDGQTWHADPSVRGRSMSGTLHDLWLAGRFTTIQRWDGTAWSRVTTRSLGQTVVIASPGRVLLPGSALGHVALLRE